MKKFIVYIALLVVLSSSCKKQESINEIPEIEFLSITPQMAKEFSDDIHIRFKYKDGNGDLGENNADVFNLFVTDKRLNLEYKYRISQLSPSGSSISIQGTLDVLIEKTGITDSSAMQDVSFSLYVVDRAGNQSNRIQTPAIQIVKN
ncbi:MAG TPA: hypothetical protein PKH65_05935 [Bacteroidia bacterium]|nr:hypothetical protein [Bacteroidia bacterium]HNT80204.1 hypothetical protein [Bacteroidia bacterium]